MKKILPALLIALIISPIPAGAATYPDEQFVIDMPPGGQPSLGVVIEDSQKLKNTFSTLQAYTAKGDQVRGNKVATITDCNRVGDPGCEKDKFFNYMANLDHCSESLTTDCVAKVEAFDVSGKSLTVNPVGSFPENMEHAFTGNPALNLPSGGSTYLVDIPEAPHQGGTQYLIVAQLVGDKDFNQKQFNVGEFNLGIFAVSRISGSYQITHPSDDPSGFQFVGSVSNMRVPWDNGKSERARCAQSSRTECLLAWPLPLDIDFGITMKFHSKITGWLHGRTSNTTANISRASDGDQLVRVSGKPSIVPTVYAWFNKSDLPPSVAAYYKAHPDELLSGTGFGERNPDNSIPSMLKDTFGYYDRELPEALAWYAALGDKAAYAPTQWSMRSTGNGGDTQGCFRNPDSLSGVVSTNSNFFISGPPQFNKAQGSLDYKVASPHFLPNGDVFKGTYNLVIKSDVARCLYGFTSAPISASVSVVSSDGTSQLATSVIGERNGWLYLSASGFTFSSPTLRVKLTQKNLKKSKVTRKSGK